MQTQAMNQFGNNQQKGFGGAPQPQRQGGRRGNRGFSGAGQGGFRNTSRFDQPQRPQNPQGGQRPQDEPSPVNAGDKPAQQIGQAQKPPVGQAQKPPVGQAQKPPVGQAQKPPTPVQPQKPQTPATGPGQQQQKPAQTPPSKPESKDIVDKAAPEQKTPQQNALQQNQNQQQRPQQNQNQQPRPQQQQQQQQHPHQQQHPLQQQQHPHQQQQQHQQQQHPHMQQQQQQRQQQFQNQNNMNGAFGGNKQGGGWQGGPGHKQGGQFGQKRGPPGSGGPGGAGGREGRDGQGFGGQGFGQGGPRNQRGGRQFQDGGKPIQREEQMLANKLRELQGPLIDLPPLDQSEIKFNGRSRLYIGNLTNDVTEEEISKMFGEFGETAELFLNKEKMFGFIKLDYRVNAERAKHALDGRIRNGKPLRVRFAPHNSAVRVKNLPPFVSNELLYRAFEIFGKIERAYVKVDERGKSLGEGVVEFVRKPSALAAIRNCTEKCFFLTSSLRPVIVENFEEPDELDGYQEKNLPKKHPEFLKARELGPRFSEPGTFEHEYGTRWKQLHELHRQKEDALKNELSAEEEKLEAQMEYAKYEHETELLREQLRQREQDRERQKRTWEMAERAAEERREQERLALLRQEEELANRMRLQDDELRRRQQENTLFVQAQRLNNMLDRQEQGMFDQQKPADGGFRDQYESRGGFDEIQGRGGWDNRQDDFPNKRRRF